MRNEHDINNAENAYFRDFLTLTQAAKVCPKRPSISTLWRWMKKGLLTRSGNRVYLQHSRIGRENYTTRSWLQSFFMETAIGDQETPESRPCRSRKSGRKRKDNFCNDQINDAYRELEQEGV